MRKRLLWLGSAAFIGSFLIPSTFPTPGGPPVNFGWSVGILYFSIRGMLQGYLPITRGLSVVLAYLAVFVIMATALRNIKAPWLNTIRAIGACLLIVLLWKMGGLHRQLGFLAFVSGAALILASASSTEPGNCTGPIVVVVTFMVVVLLGNFSNLNRLIFRRTMKISETATVKALIKVEVKFAEEKPAADHLKVASEDSQLTAYVSSETLINNSDVDAVRCNPRQHPYDLLSCLIQLNVAGGQKLSSITRSNTGRRVAVLIDGHLIMVPVIRSSVDNGELPLDEVGLQHNPSVVKFLQQPS